MSTQHQPPPATGPLTPPSTPAAALAMLEAALDALNAADAGSLPGAVQADVLRALERAEAKHTAARAAVLAAFTAQRTFEHDGQGSARTWLKWQTRITGGAAAAAVSWARRLSAHPAIAQALAAGAVSASWARDLCAWTDLLPAGNRPAADDILLDAARRGAGLGDLAGLAHEMLARCAGPDEDTGDGFADRGLHLGVTFRRAGRLNADLTPECTAALSTVLDALGKKAGPEDERTGAQRRHDALEEACRRLIAAGHIPGRAGCTCGGCTCGWGTGRPAPGPLPPKTLRRLQDTLLAYAADVLSGPAGLAAFLRTRLLAAEFPPAISLPLDAGEAGSTVPPQLRRAVTARDRHCAAPGCTQPPANCHVHHIAPRSEGGPTTLGNLVLLCSFHHLIAVHRWGWTITLNPDGTTTMRNPDGSKTFHSHSPPTATAV
jgi:Domain of unknown function (DUF222)/HNH endonuclease